MQFPSRNATNRSARSNRFKATRASWVWTNCGACKENLSQHYTTNFDGGVQELWGVRSRIPVAVELTNIVWRAGVRVRG
jgi:hypothetical protein